MDANARLGSVTAPHVGRYGAEAETPSGKALRRATAQAGLFLPTTFPEHAQGVAPSSWTSAKGTTGRIDYIALPSSWQRHVVRQVDPA
eukprot:15448349-Alexandrium_andersonii.AAC.1